MGEGTVGSLDPGAEAGGGGIVPVVPRPAGADRGGRRAGRHPGKPMSET